MKVISVVSQPLYAAIGIVSALLMSVVYLYSQVLGNLHNIDIWIKIIPWYNALLFVVFVVLFGMTISYQVYMWRQPKACSVAQKTKGAGASSAATIAAFFVAQCPACASLGAVLLPVGAVAFIAQAGTAINIISIALMLFTLHYLGGFRKK